MYTNIKKACKTNQISCDLPLQLENWSEPKSRKTPEIDLLVPPGQLPIGEALIKAMYEKQIDLSALSQQQQLQLLQLADAYSVHKVSFAACSSLSKLCIADLEWTTAAAVFSLPDSCSQLEPFKQLRAAALSKLQQELGDLDVVWSGKDGSLEQQQDQKQQQQRMLLGLPFAALHQLLIDKRTKAYSEDTVFHTMCCWVATHAGSVSTGQLQQLAAALRMPQCSPTYLASVVLAEFSWLRRFYPCTSDLFRVCAMAGASKSSSSSNACKLLWDTDNIPAFKGNPSWSLPARPPSQVKSGALCWNVPLGELRAQFEEAIATCATAEMNSPAQVWQGRRFYYSLDCTVSSGPTSCRLDLFVMFREDVAADLMLMAGKTEGSPMVRVVKNSIPSGCGHGRTDFFGCGTLKSWEEAEQKLRELSLVHADGCLHLRAIIRMLA